MAKQKLKILLVAPLSIGLVNGGVRTQAVFTAEYLSKLNTEIKLFNPWKIHNPGDFDIIHTFTAGYETTVVVKQLSDSGAKVVVSPVHYTRQSPKAVRAAQFIEKTGNKVFSGIHTGYSVKKEICENADLLLPNTNAESEQIIEGFGIDKSKIVVIPNGVESRFADAKPDLFQNKYNLKNFTLFVGDASAHRKNLLPLLKKITPDDNPLVVIGNLDDSDYSLECYELIKTKENLLHINNMDHDDPMLESAYAAAGVFVLPSYYETPGIAAMEAALAGCKIVITENGGTKEVFQDEATYLNPKSPDSIIEAVRSAHKKSSPDVLKDRLLNNFTWDKVAEQTLEAYFSIL